MEKTVGLLIVAAAFVLAFIMGPMSYLLTGRIEYNKVRYPHAEPILRSRDPHKFYRQVALKTGYLLALTIFVYWLADV